MGIIDELWYGNICPRDEVTDGSRYYKKLTALKEQNRDKLNSTLTDAQKETLEKYDDNINEMNGIAEREAFAYGIRLGLRLAFEVIAMPDADDTE